MTTKTAKMTLKINRAKWLRGENSDETYLYRSTDGKMCCLGFYARAKHIPIENIIDVTTPRNVDPSLIPKWGSLMKECDCRAGFCNSQVCEDLIEINDDIGLDAKKREREIRKLFATIGVKVEFWGRTSAKQKQI